MAEVGLSNDEDLCSPAKKITLETENASETGKNIHDTEISLPDFEIKRILQNNTMRKQVCIQGAFKGRDESSVIVIERSQFPNDPDSIKKQLFNQETTVRKLYSNDIYGNYEFFPCREFGGLTVMLIHPATQKHIDKFKRNNLYIVNETYDLYKRITLPHIESHNFSLQWVYNILEHKAEQNKIVYEDKDEKTGFVLVNDLKWNGQRNTLKIIALPFQKIRSMRELNGSHLPLLKNIRDSGTETISKKFNIPASQLRIYLHYQPSYYHLHVHFAYLMFETPGIYVEKAHLLSTVISNLELVSDYYTKTVLSYVVFETDPLCQKFIDEGVITEAPTESTDTEPEK